MGEDHSPANHNPQRIMFFPYSTNHQLIVTMANSLKETIRLTPDQRHAELYELQARRVHELMHYRSHTVYTD